MSQWLFLKWFAGKQGFPKYMLIFDLQEHLNNTEPTLTELNVRLEATATEGICIRSSILVMAWFQWNGFNTHISIARNGLTLKSLYKYGTGNEPLPQTMAYQFILGNGTNALAALSGIGS